MGNFRNRLKENFSTIPNELLFDCELSIGARFTYCIMASKPENWEFYTKTLASDIGCCVDTLYGFINELVAKGWLVKGRQKNDGRFGSVEYTLMEKATVSENLRDGKIPCRKNSVTENFRDGKFPTQNNKDIENNKEKESKKKEKEENLKRSFEDAWKAYGRKGSKRNALKRWMALSDADREKAMVHIPFYIKSNERQYLKDFEGYLNQHTFDNVVSDRKGNIVFDPERKVDGKYRPSEGGMISWSKSHGMYLFTGPNERMVFDGYDDTDRPDGAELVFNNGRGVYSWSAEQRKWIRKQE